MKSNLWYDAQNIEDRIDGYEPIAEANIEQDDWCDECDMDHSIADCPKSPDYDPTPWCSGCKSMTQEGCDCGPIAEND